MSITKRYSSYIEEQKTYNNLKLNHHKLHECRRSTSIRLLNVVTLPKVGTR